MRGAGAKLYIDHIRATHEGVEPYRGLVRVRVVWVRERRSGDLDNRLKIVLDALRGIAYADDNQITKIEAERIDRASKRQRGFAMVLVEELND